MIADFSDWYTALSLMEQIYWSCALIGSAIFLIQLVLTLVGMDASDVEVDFDGPDTLDHGGGMSLFSVRAFVNFLVGFGWTGVCFRASVSNHLLLLLLSLLVGVFFAWIILFVWRKVKGLERNASFSLQECVGLTATVYLRIPPSLSGKGKVQVSVRGSVHEIDAKTRSDREQSTGSSVRITEVLTDSVLLVESL